jgi:prefoldin beta subunit
MDIDAETSEKIQELQVLEQNLQSLMMEKQSMQIELNEVSNALSEISKAKSDVYQILGGIMVKSSAQELSKSLEEKKSLLNMKIHSIEKQESILEGKSAPLRREINSAVTKKKS